jgi:hypothetical protein
MEQPRKGKLERLASSNGQNAMTRPLHCTGAASRTFVLLRDSPRRSRIGGLRVVTTPTQTLWSVSDRTQTRLERNGLDTNPEWAWSFVLSS